MLARSLVLPKMLRRSSTAAGQAHLESAVSFWHTAQGILLFSGEFHLKRDLDLQGGVCYVHPASYASTLDDAPQVRCYGHGWSTTVGAEDMMKCSRNPSQGGDVAGVGLLLVVCPALMSPVNPSADPVPQLPKRV